jgi:hypothetical protein
VPFLTIAIHQLPHLILVQPNRIRVPSDELVDRQTVDLLRSRHSFLLAIDEDRHVLPFPFPPLPLFSRGQLAFPLWHELTLLDSASDQVGAQKEKDPYNQILRNLGR